jgi:hypothetical protein
MTDLNFSYDSTLNCSVAFHNGYRIRAEHDPDASNPFEDHDGNWPIGVRAGRRESITYYEKTPGPGIETPFAFATDEMIVHMQVHIAKAFGFSTVGAMLGILDLEHILVTYTQDAALLREAAEQALADEQESELFGMLVEIYTVLGIPAYTTQVTGYCQGDWSDVLVVATPQAQKEFGCTEVTPDDLENTAKLYGWWVFGDTYGYVIERPIEVDEDGDVTEWEEIEHGSCWGYYGPDHDKSGLTEAALECAPEEVPTPKVREDA